MSKNWYKRLFMTPMGLWMITLVIISVGALGLLAFPTWLKVLGGFTFAIGSVLGMYNVSKGKSVLKV